jgi:hypothetical protein
MRLCAWKCGRQTKNRSGICDQCWKLVEPLRANTEAGYRAWCKYQATVKAEEAAKRPMTARQKAHLEKLNASRASKLATELTEGELSDASTIETTSTIGLGGTTDH